SPLLRLPAEVRSMVWEYVFGCYHIYVYPGDIFASDLHGIPLSINSRVRLEFWSKDTMAPYQKMRHQPTLGLMTVCRQIYMEAVLLPFQLNTWHIDSRYLKKLISDKLDYPIRPRELVTSVISYSTMSSTLSDKDVFPNLKTVVLRYEFYNGWYFSNCIEEDGGSFRCTWRRYHRGEWFRFTRKRREDMWQCGGESVHMIPVLFRAGEFGTLGIVDDTEV
ncbi:hypothetical protein COCVIDRAFT_99796, partial [Bipolaris victoriae FI3]